MESQDTQDTIQAESSACPTGTQKSHLLSDSASILRIFGANTMWLWLDLGGLRLGTMAAGLFLIRYFGPANFGVYSTALAAGWLANAVVDLGLTRYAARAIAASADEGPSILALNLLTTVGSAGLEILVLVAAIATGHWQVACFAAGFVLCNFEGTSSLCASILTADLRSKAILPGSILGAAGLIGITIAVILLHLSVLTMLVALCFKSLVVLGVRLWQSRPFWPLRESWRPAALIQTARLAWPFFAYNLTQVGYGRIAILCFGFVAPAEQVGWFAAAFTLSDIVPQWSYASSGAILPLWTRLFESKRIEELVALRQRLLDIVMFISVPLAVSLAVFAPQVCHLLGGRYAQSVPVLRVVASRCVLAVLDGFLGHGFLVAINRVRERQAALMRCVLLLGALSLAFGGMWGAVGVAVALLIADSSLILQYLRIISGISMKIDWPAVLPSFISGMFMAAVGIAVPHSIGLAARLPLAFIVYLAVLALLSRSRLRSASQTLWQCFGGAWNWAQ